MNVYLDHAATTPLAPEVRQHMIKLMEEVNGNPSSLHSYGKAARGVIDDTRKYIAEILGAEKQEICFTSGGTEADNMAIRSAVRNHGVQHVLTTPIEHHAVLHTLQHMAGEGEISLHYVQVDNRGHVDTDDLEAWLKKHPGSLVSIVHANNEVGTMADLETIGNLSHAYDSLFHTDTVQSVGYFNFNLKELPVDFLAGSAHKFYGPKGVGFLYHQSDCNVAPIIHGGGQEQHLRSGTENVHGIAGMGKALELMEEQRAEFAPRMKELKTYFINRLRDNIPGISFNGDPEGRSNYTVINATLPEFEGQMLFFARLDQAGIAASGGSACSGGGKSHVIEHLGGEHNGVTVRFSIGTSTTRGEIDYTVDKIMEIIGVSREPAPTAK